MSDIKKTKFSRRLARNAVDTTKTLLKSNSVTRRAGIKFKKIVLADTLIMPRDHYSLFRYYPSIAEWKKQSESWQEFKKTPLISVLIPTYNTDPQFLSECIESVLVQSYPNWELCIADDASTDPDVKKVIKQYTKQDKRIKSVFRSNNGHISAASNSALEIAKGEYISLLDHDDILWPNALYEIINAINSNPSAELIYTDEDKIEEETGNHAYPFFKPDWSPEFLESCNYITHFSTIKATTMKKIGGFRVGYEGAQDWDLFIRISEITSNIVHISKILYSWRIHANSTALDTDTKPYVYAAQRNLLVDHLTRKGLTAEVKPGIIKQHSTIIYNIDSKSTVDVAIFAKNIKTANRLKSKLQKNTTLMHANYIIYLEREGFTEVMAYSKLISTSEADFLVFITDEIFDISRNWLEILIGDAGQEKIAIVGPRLVDLKSKLVLSSGIGLGLGNVYADLLKGMDVSDMHYIRGLYSNSRRNVSSVNPAFFIVKRERLKLIEGFDLSLGQDAFIDLSLQFNTKGFRHIYNPNVQATAQLIENSINHDKLVKKWKSKIGIDPYVNPNFALKNGNLDLI